MKRMFWILGLALMLVVAFPAAAQENLLTNPGFDNESFTLIGTDPADPLTTYNAPYSWWGGFLTPTNPNEPWRNAYPNGFPHSAGLKRSGRFSYNMGRGGSIFTAWVYQQVNVTPDTDVQGGAWAFIEGTTGQVRVGIDPTGATDPFGGSVVWSSYSGAAYQWQQVSVSARATAGTVTLFLFATQNAPANPNGVYWDEAYLLGTAGAAPAAPGSPTAPSGQGVTADIQVRVRSGAGTTFARIGRINPGEVYTFLGQQGDWYMIDYNGQTGYVSTQFAVLTGAVSAPAAPSAPSVPSSGSVGALDLIVDYTLRLRNAPNTTSETLTRIPSGTTVQVTARSADAAWLLTTYDGQTGWVSARFGRLNGDVAALPIQ